MDQRGVWNEIAKDWEKQRRIPFPEAMKIIKKMRGRVLDIGCGSGRNFCDKITDAVDFSDEMIRLAENRAKEMKLSIDVKVADATKLPYTNNSFDNIVMVAVLHCIKNRDKALQEAKRILKSKGKIMITVWDKDQRAFEKCSKEMLREWKVDSKSYKRYYYLFSKEELIKLMEETGFKILGVKKFEFGPQKYWNILLIAEKPSN